MMAASSQSNWEISMYEAHRKPHELIIDDSLIAVSPRALHAELMCPICLDLMRNTQTTKECLHRFCQECIITALRSGNKECPTCRKKLVSKRSLRPDPNFDALIAKIYPNREELSNQQEKHHPTRATPVINSAIQKRKRKSDISATGSNETPPSSRASTPLNAVGDKRVKLGANNDSLDDLSDSEGSVRQATLMPTIEFQLRPHPDDADLSNYIIRNLCSTPDTTVAHLIKFLQLIEKENASFSSSELCLSIDEDQSKNYVNLSRSISLKQICDQYWTGEKLKLFFSLPGSIQN